MSSLIKEKKEREKSKEENGNSKSKISKEQIDEKEEVSSNLTNLKVFNGLIEEDNIFKNLNKTNKNSKDNVNSNKNNKNDLYVYFNNNKMIDLNYISFGDCDNLFVNNINTKKDIFDKKNKKDSKNKKNNNSNNSKSKNKKTKHSHTKRHYNNINCNSNTNINNIKIQKKYVEEILTNDYNKMHKTMSFNEPKEIKNESMFNLDKKIIETNDKKSKNFFKISSIKNGIALLVTENDVVFTYPAYLLPKGAKLGETFSLEIKLFEKKFDKKRTDEILQIQKKYSYNEIGINNK